MLSNEDAADDNDSSSTDHSASNTSAEACMASTKVAKDDRLVMELLCPITQELPIDPVWAADGYFYERIAIAKWFAERKAFGNSATSPMTGKTMSTRLIDAVPVRNTIPILVEKEFLGNEHADAWLEEKKQLDTDRSVVSTLKQKAEAGEPQAMHDLGRAFANGLHGLPHLKLLLSANPADVLLAQAQLRRLTLPRLA
tara:strand:+ start:1084 stop:1677 length:594 start_codon:yes stop_codon:yes gene_type:complete